MTGALWAAVLMLAGGDLVLSAVVAVLVRESERMMRAFSASYRSEADTPAKTGGHYSAYKPRGENLPKGDN